VLWDGSITHVADVRFVLRRRYVRKVVARARFFDRKDGVPVRWRPRAAP